MKVTIFNKTNQNSIETVLWHNSRDNLSLAEILRSGGSSISMPCQGRGTCGKCKIKVLSGQLDLSAADKHMLTENEQSSNVRLACQAHPKEDIEILTLWEPENNISSCLAVSDESNNNYAKYHNQTQNKNQGQTFGIAIDIGTTTLAFALVDLSNKTTVHSTTAVNHQRSYGFDVASRITAGIEGKLVEMKRLILEDLNKGIISLLAFYNISSSAVKSIVISGNTTMLHILRGFSLDTLGVYPFTPVNLKLEEFHSAQEVLSDYSLKDLCSDITILPGISTYIGADIVSGLFSLTEDIRKGTVLLIDIGTNGEMALIHKNTIYAASTAAGPAFEGGNISCGVASICGAICKVTINPLSRTAKITTIDNMPPIGICGSGVIEAAAEMVKNKIIDKTGLINSRYIEDGYPLAISKNQGEISFTQEDVRQFQMAKGAIRSGIEILLDKASIKPSFVDKVILSGGFGSALNIEKAIISGLIPKEFENNCVLAGNTSLSGAIKYLISPKKECIHALNQIIDSACEIQLGGNSDFVNKYITYMNF